MNKFFTDLWAKIKALWGKLAKPVKILIPAAACALIIAVAVSIIISAGKKSEYQVLFNGENLSQSETNSAYAELQSWGVSARLNSAGQIEVPTEQADTVMLRMAENGFTQSTPGYSMFFDNISITMTEFEKKETLRMATEEKMNALLRRFEGIRNAEVMLSVPENVDRVWKSEEEKAAEKASASVSLWLEPGAKFDHNSVSAVKNLVSYNVEKMTPDDVTVIDAGNGVRELTGVEDVVEGFDELGSEERRRFYEGLTEQGYEEKVHKIFDPVFGAENVSVAATASLDYDKV
ncbi:MAG: flagellar M-ring protein FliF, partial [Oscillospiraceae bacterium]|nr:flagellar M-ring protein FliF [Oscillospiraceae bacterium]